MSRGSSLVWGFISGGGGRIRDVVRWGLLVFLRIASVVFCGGCAFDGRFVGGLGCFCRLRWEVSKDSFDKIIIIKSRWDHYYVSIYRRMIKMIEKYSHDYTTFLEILILFVTFSIYYENLTVRVEFYRFYAFNALAADTLLRDTFLTEKTLGLSFESTSEFARSRLGLLCLQLDRRTTVNGHSSIIIILKIQ